MHNVGSVFRTADAFLLRVSVYAAIHHNLRTDIHKTALGATETVDWLYFPTTLAAVLTLKECGYKIFAIEQAEGRFHWKNLPIQFKNRHCFW